MLINDAFGINNNGIELYDTAILMSNLIKQIDSGNCLNLILDNQYVEILNTMLFQEALHEKPYYMIKILDYEDMKSPNYLTVKSLMEVQKAGCPINIIFLANGIQMGRFLEFLNRLNLNNNRR